MGILPLTEKSISEVKTESKKEAENSLYFKIYK